MNLIIIPSIIKCTDKRLSYTNVRSVYSTTERYEQLLKTIRSVREKIPNAYIVLIECSKDIEEYEKIMYPLVNEYINYYNNNDIKNAVESIYKGYGESLTIYTFLKNHFINKDVLEQYENIIKISGRYYLNDKFNYNIFDNDKNIFRYYSEHNNVSTRLYKINKKYFEIYVSNFIDIIKKCIKGDSIENVIVSTLPYKYVDYIGVSGYIAIAKNKFIDE
jgi:hypothetical protein